MTTNRKENCGHAGRRRVDLLATPGTGFFRRGNKPNTRARPLDDRQAGLVASCYLLMHAVAAAGSRRYGLPLDRCTDVATDALMRSASVYDEAKGKFSTFAANGMKMSVFRLTFGRPAIRDRPFRRLPDRFPARGQAYAYDGDPFAAADARVVLGKIRTILSDVEWLVLSMRYLEDAEIVDIAAASGRTPGHVRNIISRAAARVRNAVAEGYEL